MRRRSRRPFRAPLACAALFLLAAAVSATSVIAPTFNELVDGSREIFVGTTLSRSSQWVETRDGRAIVTLITFTVEESLKGGLQTQTSLEFLGGTVEGVTMAVADMPQFAVGDRDVLFVGDRNAVRPLIGFMHGRFRVLSAGTRGVDTVRMHDGLPLSATAGIGRTAMPGLRGAPGLALADFKAEILARVRVSARRIQ